VNNAGIGAVGDITANDDEWHRVFDVNVVGIARVTRAALPHLRASASAAIVNTCSVVAHVGLPQRALYGASKGAVAALTLAMAVDHVKDGIRVNAGPRPARVGERPMACRRYRASPQVRRVWSYVRLPA
jgi:2-keto-3-deoxy-L-fuconate dehydrogenase